MNAIADKFLVIMMLFGATWLISSPWLWIVLGIVVVVALTLAMSLGPAPTDPTPPEMERRRRYAKESALNNAQAPDFAF